LSGEPVPDARRTRHTAPRPSRLDKERKAQHHNLEKLFTQKGGCPMHDTYNAGYAYPAAQALKMFEKRGYKVSTKKERGQLTVYSATKRGA